MASMTSRMRCKCSGGTAVAPATVHVHDRIIVSGFCEECQQNFKSKKMKLLRSGGFYFEQAVRRWICSKADQFDKILLSRHVWRSSPPDHLSSFWTLTPERFQVHDENITVSVHGSAGWFCNYIKLNFFLFSFFLFFFCDIILRWPKRAKQYNCVMPLCWWEITNKH